MQYRYLRGRAGSSSIARSWHICTLNLTSTIKAELVITTSSWKYALVWNSCLCFVVVCLEGASSPRRLRCLCLIGGNPFLPHLCSTPTHRHRFTTSIPYRPTYRDATAATIRRRDPSCAASRQSVKSPGGVPLGDGRWRRRRRHRRGRRGSRARGGGGGGGGGSEGTGSRSEGTEGCP